MSHAVVIGAGPTGLVTAMLLAGQGWQVTVLDRDAAAPVGDAGRLWSEWRRPAVKQFLHTHCLLPGGFQDLRAEIPAVVDRLLDLGARPHNMIGGAWGVGRVGDRQPGDERFETVAVRRPVLEAALAEQALQTSGVTIRRGVQVSGLLTGPGPLADTPHITGVLTDEGDSVAADLVVDASGRSSAMTAVLAKAGVVVPQQQATVGFRYYTRFFRSADGALPAQLPWPNSHQDGITILTAPGDNHTWSVTLVASGRDQAMRVLSDTDTWNRALALYPDAAHWGNGEPITRVSAMGGTESRHRRLVVGDRPVATGIVLLGDAWATIDPQFGTGMTMGIRHAVMLRDVLALLGADDLVEVALRLDALTEGSLTPVWESYAGWDRHRFAEIDATIRGETYATDDPQWNLLLALESARWKDPALLRGMAEVACMVATPDEALVRPGLVEKAFALAAGDPRYTDPGPSRSELLALLERG
jgi:2-polyprenyl-6-methoxyphenol hydroxylase-like FAD-dependent oxidoreductase